MNCDRSSDNRAGLAQRKLKDFKVFRLIDAERFFLQASAGVVAMLRNGLLGCSLCDPCEGRVAVLLALRDSGFPDQSQSNEAEQSVSWRLVRHSRDSLVAGGNPPSIE